MGSFLFLLFFLFLLEPEEEEAESSDRSSDASDSILLNSALAWRQAGRVSISLTSACRLCRLIRSSFTFSFAAFSTLAFLLWWLWWLWWVVVCCGLCVVSCFTVPLIINACDVTTKLVPDAPSPRRMQTTACWAQFPTQHAPRPAACSRGRMSSCLSQPGSQKLLEGGKRRAFCSDSRAQTWQSHQPGTAASTGAVRGHSSSSSVSVAGNGQLIFARGGYPRLILLKASRVGALTTPEHCVLSLQKDREVHAAQFQHHVNASILDMCCVLLFRTWPKRKKVYIKKVLVN